MAGHPAGGAGPGLCFEAGGFGCSQRKASIPSCQARRRVWEERRQSLGPCLCDSHSWKRSEDTKDVTTQGTGQDRTPSLWSLRTECTHFIDEETGVLAAERTCPMSPRSPQVAEALKKDDMTPGERVSLTLRKGGNGADSGALRLCSL